jgi:hypothetical protein
MYDGRRDPDMRTAVCARWTPAADENHFTRSTLDSGMSDDDRNELHAAAETLDDLRAEVSDAETAERVESFADQLRTMADADRGPDHGRLARLEHNLRDLQSDLDGEEAETVGSALDHAKAYRETVEGV